MAGLRNTLLAGVGIALVLAAGMIAGADGSPAPVHPAVPVRVATVHLVAAARTASYAAVIVPRVEANVGFRVAGKIAARLVEVGDHVEAGTKLARLDPADLQLRAASIEAQLASANADATNARHDLERYAQLRASEVTTQQEYDRRKAASETADAKVRDVEAQRRLAADNVRYATLEADGPGVVTAVLAEPGQVVSEGQTIVRIARLGEMEASADVPEQDVASLADTELSVTLWSLPGVTIKGRVREIAPSADAATRTYRAKVTLVDPPPSVRLGMTATLVGAGTARGSIAVLPATALASRDSAPAVFVLNARGDGLELRPIRVAGYRADQLLVTDGLAEGDRVVTAGVQKLDASEKVRIWTEPVR